MGLVATKGPFDASFVDVCLWSLWKETSLMRRICRLTTGEGEEKDAIHAALCDKRDLFLCFETERDIRYRALGDKRDLFLVL